MTDGPVDGDGDESKGEKPGLKLIRGGKTDPKDIGADYVVGHTGDVPTPEIVDPVAVDHEVQDRIRYVKQQELVQAAGRGASTTDMVDIVLKEIAEELAHLKYERRKAAKENKNTANYTIGRANALKGLVELLLKRKEAALAERLDLKSPRFQAVFKVWLEYFHESMEKVGIEPQIMDLVFQQMRADMIDWEKKMDIAGVD